jgi:hypothetical protein
VSIPSIWRIRQLPEPFQNNFLNHYITDERIVAFFEKRNKSRRSARVSSRALDEIEQRQGKITAQDVINHIDLLLALAQRSKGNIHTYLKFYGD